MIAKLKKFNIIIVIAVLIILVVITLIIKAVTAPKPADQSQVIPTPVEALPTIDSSVEVDMKFVNNNHGMELTIANIPDGTTSIDYEVSYTTGEGIPKGNIGSIKLKNGENQVERSGEELTLGTCSRGKCVYYDGVAKVNLSLKFNKSDGSAAIFQKEYTL